MQHVLSRLYVKSFTEAPILRVHIRIQNNLRSDYVSQSYEETAE